MERNLIWAGAIAAATVGGSLVAACLMPFIALAAMAASTLPRREGLATVALAWATNQAIGFLLLGFPADAGTIGWGGALGVSAIAAYALIRRLTRGTTSLALLLGASALAFVAYEVILYAYGLAIGGTDAFTPAIVGLIAWNEALWLAGLLVAREAIVRLAPRWAPGLRAAG